MPVTTEMIRKIAMSLPGAEERVSWGLINFRLKKGIFCGLSEDETSLGFRFPKEERPGLIASEPEKFFTRKGHDDSYDWLRVHLHQIDEAEARELIVEAWRRLAPKSAYS